MYKKHLEPQKHFADIVIGEETDIASSVVSAQITKICQERSDDLLQENTL